MTFNIPTGRYAVKMATARSSNLAWRCSLPSAVRAQLEFMASVVNDEDIQKTERVHGQQHRRLAAQLQILKQRKVLTECLNTHKS